jgi:hypothetical protein
MHADLALHLLADLLWTALVACLPILGLTMLVGVLISFLQVELGVGSRQRNSASVPAKIDWHRMHDEIELGDYLQYARIGLLEALDRFDPAVGVMFRTFAARRMHVAILDGIERLTEKQQQIAVTAPAARPRAGAQERRRIGRAPRCIGTARS